MVPDSYIIYSFRVTITKAATDVDVTIIIVVEIIHSHTTLCRNHLFKRNVCLYKCTCDGCQYVISFLNHFLQKNSFDNC